MTDKKERSMTHSRNEELKHEFERSSRIVEEKMQEVLKEALTGDSFKDKLSDGTALCKLVNLLKPGCLRQYHRKPRSLMMKIENIGFFLNTAKARFNVPQTSLFQPNDLQEKSEDNALMIRVLNVITLVFKEAGIIIEAGEINLDDKPPSPQVHPPKDTGGGGKNEEIESPRVGAGKPSSPRSPRGTENGLHKTNSSISTPTSTPTTTTTTTTTTPTPTIPTPTATQNKPEVKGSWYINGRANEYVDIQPDVTKEILECIHNELSIESKLVLLSTVVKHNDAIEEKLVYASDSDLRSLCFEMGLGSRLEDVPAQRDRKWYVEWILKYGRSK